METQSVGREVFSLLFRCVNYFDAVLLCRGQAEALELKR